MGSGALAGNPLGIDRTKLALKLEFDSVTSNSMHAVGDRDYVGNFQKKHESKFKKFKPNNFISTYI